MSLERLREHRALWADKPELAAIYGVWFERLLAVLPRGARVVELGAGPGFMAAHARVHRPDLGWVATDHVAAPWNDLAADALRLPLRTAGVDALALLDVVHHLARPFRFFAEAARVLRPGGHIVAVEPWVSPLSYPVYRFAHQEGCTLGLDPERPFPEEGKDVFDGDAAVVRRLVKDTPEARWRELGLAPPRVELINTFAYLPSLGFRPRSLLPGALLRPLLALDRATAPLAPLTAFRALAVWTRG